MSIVISIVSMLLILTVLVTAHEYGHFITAVKCGVGVHEFAIGMGPVLYKKKTKHTLLTIRLFPIGGFCAMKDESGLGEEDDTREEIDGLGFCEIKGLKKILVLAAGPIMNFICAILIFFSIFCIVGTGVSTTIDSFSDNSPAKEVGIEVGDTIISINGTQIDEWEDVTSDIIGSEGNAISLEVERKGEVKTFSVVPEFNEEADRYLIGVTPKTTVNPIKAFTNSFVMLYKYLGLTFEVIGGMFTGEYGLDALSGPIGATAVLNEVLPQGFIYVLNIAAAISVSLGLFNLLPIPALDGSRILVVIVEMIKGSPVNKKVENFINMGGFVFMILLAVVIAFKDIITLF